MKPAFRFLSLALLLILGGGSEAIAAPRAPEVLAPSSAWTVDYAPKKCTAGRRFGAGKDEVLIVLEQIKPGSNFTLTFVGPRFEYADETGSKPRIRFGPDEAEQEYDFLVGKLGTAGPMLLGRNAISIAVAPVAPAGAPKPAETNDPPITDSRLAAVRTLDLRYHGRTIQLPTGRFDQLMQAMTACTDNLVRSWGFDPAVMKSLTRGPKPKESPANWLLDTDYPSVAQANGQRAIVSLRLNVDDKGAVTACDILQSTRGGNFGKVVCDVLPKRARFEPALDTLGRPVAGYFVTRVVFLIG